MKTGCIVESIKTTTVWNAERNS